MCNDELLPITKIKAFLSQSKFGRESNPIPYQEQEYLPGSAVLVNFTKNLLE